MGPDFKEAQKVRELFEAHFTVSEIVERTGMSIETVVSVLNAPRLVKRAAKGASGEVVEPQAA